MSGQRDDLISDESLKSLNYEEIVDAICQRMCDIVDDNQLSTQDLDDLHTLLIAENLLRPKPQGDLH